tara:strand:+ start:944 stop:1123 length:180 start_codon:yes stop_codon:yes gene_type:complete
MEEGRENLAKKQDIERIERKIDNIVNKLLAMSKEDTIIKQMREEKDARISDALSSLTDS